MFSGRFYSENTKRSILARLGAVVVSANGQNPRLAGEIWYNQGQVLRRFLIQLADCFPSLAFRNKDKIDIWQIASCTEVASTIRRNCRTQQMHLSHCHENFPASYTSFSFSAKPRFLRRNSLRGNLICVQTCASN
jgi:hypothetical protein